MSWVAAAVIGSAVVGGVASSRASSRASEGAERGQDILAASRETARQDVKSLFPSANAAQTQGFQQGQDFIANQVLPQQVTPFQQGNVAAQQTLLAGLPQIQNAILGRQTDMSGIRAQQFAPPSFDLAGLGGRPQPQQGGNVVTDAPITTVPFNLQDFLANNPQFDFSNLSGITSGGFNNGGGRDFNLQNRESR